MEVVFLCENDSLYVLNHDGTRYGHGFPIHLRSNAQGLAPSPAIVDLEDDGQMEIVAAGVQTDISMYITVVTNQGQVLPGWPVHLDDSSEASPVVVDLDDDHAFEILLGTEHGYLHAFELDGSNMDGFPIHTDAELRSSPTIDDVDGDYCIDVGVVGWDWNIYIWDLPDRYRNGMAQWKMFRANPARTGVFTREEQIVGVEEETPVLPVAGRLYANFPNPFNPSTRIRLATPAGGGELPVRLTVHDIQGRLVKVLHDGGLARGVVHSFIWDGKDEDGNLAASGVYFTRAEMEGRTSSRKMVLLK
jgi:hypothetical protein